MAVKKGLTPLFTHKQLDNRVDDFKEEIISNEVKVMQFVGESFVNEARNLRTYRDVTGNLRSSISYVVGVDGRVAESNHEGKNPVGVGKGRTLARRKAKGKGTILVGVAGMEYGRSVEARGKDVISGPAEKAQRLFKTLIAEI